MITERERFLMREWVEVSHHYKNLEEWLSEVICDVGCTVEQSLDHSARKHEEKSNADI